MPSSLGRGFVVIAFVAVSSSGLGAARADPPQSGEVFVPCAFRGNAVMPLDTIITDAGGRPIARFSGAETHVTVAGLSTASPPRARIETGGGFRVRGFVEAKKLPLATSTSVPVVAGHVWIGARRPVSVVAATRDKLELEKRLTTPLKQTFTAWATCGQLLLGSAVPPGWSPAGNARGYVLRAGSLDLHDSPQGNVVSTVYKSPEVTGILFHSTEQSGPWVHVEYHGEVGLDGWARASDLHALPRGETMDQLASPPFVRGPARLAVQGSPRVVRAPRKVALRSVAKEVEPIGAIEAGAETYVLDVVAGWASVLPKALDVMPVENGQFWVKKEELGL